VAIFTFNDERNTMSEPFILGVNYWPRRKAMYWWANFDAGEVREEFAVIAELGMKVVRLFLLWEDWQPTPDTVNESALDNLVTGADIAELQRRLGEFGKRQTLMFNGYGDQVASLYAGMDLKKNY
jgi:hypothetical protein